MYPTIKGIWEAGQITITEPPPTTEKSVVIVTFLGAENEQPSNEVAKPRVPGFLKKWGEELGLTFSIPDDFNEPLDDLAEYM